MEETAQEDGLGAFLGVRPRLFGIAYRMLGSAAEAEDVVSDCWLRMSVADARDPIKDVDASWQSIGGDPNLAFDEWRAMVHCERGLAQFQLTYNTRPMQSQVIIHGTADETVPYDDGAYVEAAGPEARLVALQGAGHFEAVDPQSHEWPVVAEAIRSVLDVR